MEHTSNSSKVNVAEEAESLFTELAIYDETLPSDFSPFRTLEYRHYLSFFPNSLVISLEQWHCRNSNSSFEEEIKSLPIDNKLKPRIRKFAESQTIVPRLAYITFLNNAWWLLPHLTARQIPFILQLYPGGYFEPNVPESDRRLKEVVLSPLCRKVITTQNFTSKHLVEKIGCPPEKVKLIYGGVFESRVGFDFSRDKKFYGVHKDTIDLCFVAHRYGNNFSTKGYDQFVAIAQGLSATDPRLRFHVVGDYSPEDIPLGAASDRFTFYGQQPNSFFRDFYPGMDVIISVNRPPTPGIGAFDGFPTGACMEAGFRGVLNCLHDPLGLNIEFEDGRDIILVDLDIATTMRRLTELFADPDQLYKLARANWDKYREIFDVDRQLWARTRLIVNELSSLAGTLVIRPSARASALDAHTIAAVNNSQYENILQLKGRLEDTERRLNNLIDEYKKLAQGYEARGQALEEREAQAAQLNSLSENAKWTNQRHDNLLIEYQKLAAGYEARGKLIEQLQARDASVRKVAEVADVADVADQQLADSTLKLHAIKEKH